MKLKELKKLIDGIAEKAGDFDVYVKNWEDERLYSIKNIKPLELSGSKILPLIPIVLIKLKTP